jgi:hypothetical protein
MRALQNNGIFFSDSAILSKNLVNSNWFQFELRKAMNMEIETGRVKVLPIVSDACVRRSVAVFNCQVERIKGGPRTLRREFERVPRLA